MASQAQIEANRRNSQLGRLSPNIGAPMHAQTIVAREIKKYITTFVSEHISDIVTVLYDKAMSGDVVALRELLDRALGKPVQGVELGDKDGNPIVFMPLELIQKHSLTIAENVSKLDDKPTYEVIENGSVKP